VEGSGQPVVEVASMVPIAETSRLCIARLVEPVSPATAQALRTYAHVADLF
jgi:hypothetical protein